MKLQKNQIYINNIKKVYKTAAVKQNNSLDQQMSKAQNTSRMVLPNISSAPSLSYAQRYQHMTKLANYNQLNQTQIWKQYQKLRACLKEINQQVLYHMQRKAYTNMNKQKQKPVTKDSEATLMMLQDQKATNELRYSNFYNQLAKIEQRVGYLSGKHSYLEEMALQIQDLNAKIKKTQTDIKDHQRKAKIVGKNIVHCTSVLDKLNLQENKLNRAFIRHRRLKQYLDSLASKEDMYKQRIKQTEQAFDARIKQFSTQQNFIQEEIHYQRYQQLNRQKENLTKYESVYKRNYLMKLRQLQNTVNSITRHDKVIQDNQGNIASLRNQIDAVSTLMGKTSAKKRSTSSMLQMSMNTVRVRTKDNNSRGTIGDSIDMKDQREDNDTRKRKSSVNNDKNDN